MSRQQYALCYSHANVSRHRSHEVVLVVGSYFCMRQLVPRAMHSMLTCARSHTATAAPVASIRAISTTRAPLLLALKGERRRRYVSLHGSSTATCEHSKLAHCTLLFGGHTAYNAKNQRLLARRNAALARTQTGARKNRCSGGVDAAAARPRRNRIRAREARARRHRRCIRRPTCEYTRCTAQHNA